MSAKLQMYCEKGGISSVFAGSKQAKCCSCVLKSLFFSFYDLNPVANLPVLPMQVVQEALLCKVYRPRAGRGSSNAKGGRVSFGGYVYRIMSLKVRETGMVTVQLWQKGVVHKPN